MRASALIVVTCVLLACSEANAPARGVRVHGTRVIPASFDRAQSTGLFVGIGTFGDGSRNVPYAVDDAVDLAYMFALGRNVRLVLAPRVVLVLSGEPVKPESRERLDKLKTAGARIVHTATRADILRLLEEQTLNTGFEGMFIGAFASHGFTDRGQPFVLGSNSKFGDDDTSVSVSHIIDTAARATRSLVFVDACRERVNDGRRGASTTAAAAPLQQRMTGVNGQVVLYAGEYAYDDHRKKNGVFTGAVLDCLRCDMLRDARGVVTAETLAQSVEKRVLKWINANRDPSLRTAVQVSMHLDAATMPLASCAKPPQAKRAEIDGTTIIVRDELNNELWRRDLGSRITHGEAGDLDGDEANDVVVVTETAITAFDADGEQRWTAAVPAVEKFVIEDLFRKKRRQVIAIGGPRMTVFDDDGTLLSTYTHSSDLAFVDAGRAGNLNAPRIVLADATGMVLMLNPKKVEAGKEVWMGMIEPRLPIERLEISDRDQNDKREIVIHTAQGHIVLAFDGHVLERGGASAFRMK